MQTIAEQISLPVRAYIASALEELLSDPDLGLELSARAKKRIEKSARGGQKTFSLAEIRKKYLVHHADMVA